MTEHEKHWRWAAPPVNGVARTGDGSAHVLGGVEFPAATDSSPKRDGSGHSLLPPVDGVGRTGDGSAHGLGGAEVPAATGSSPGQDGSRHSLLPPVNGVARMGDGSAHALGGVEVPAATGSSPGQHGSRHSLLPSVDGVGHMGDGSAHGLNGVGVPAATGSSPKQDGSGHWLLPPVDGVGRVGDGSAHGLNGVEVSAVTGSSPKRDGSRHSLLPPVLTARARWKAALIDRLPPTLHGRWAIDRTTGIVLAVSVLLGALLIGGWAVLRARPHEMAVSRDRPLGFGGGGGGGGTGSYPQAAPADSPQVDSLPTVPVSLPPNAGSGVGGGSGAASASVIVDVEGKVAKPGVRTLPAGSRILDALNAAGGALPGTDLTSLNQAQVLVDGEQVLVGVAPPPQDDAGGASGRGGKGKKGHGSGGPGSVEPVHLNTATVDDLEGLPGIGPALAQRVVDYRSQHGPFHSVDELRQVSGFGGQRYENLASMIAL